MSRWPRSLESGPPVLVEGRQRPKWRAIRMLQFADDAQIAEGEQLDHVFDDELSPFHLDLIERRRRRTQAQEVCVLFRSRPRFVEVGVEVVEVYAGSTPHQPSRAPRRHLRLRERKGTG